MLWKTSKGDHLLLLWLLNLVMNLQKLIKEDGWWKQWFSKLFHKQYGKSKETFYLFVYVQLFHFAIWISQNRTKKVNVLKQ